MKKYIACSLFATALLFFAQMAYGQATRVEGTVTDTAGTPMAGAQLVWHNKDNGQKTTIKTDKKGKYVAITLPEAKYDVELVKDGKVIYTMQNVPLSSNGCCGGEHEMPPINRVDIDLKSQQAMANANANALGGAAAPPAGGQAAQPAAAPKGQQPQPQLTAEQKKQIEEVQKKNAAITAENAKIGELNPLLTQAKQEDEAKQFDQAVATMKQASEVGGSYPVVWANLGNYELDWAKSTPDADTRKQRASDAVKDLTKATEMCASDTTGKLQGCDPQHIAAYHNSLGTGYANAGDSDKALAEFQLAAKADPAGATRYYFNAGAVMTNQAQKQKTDADRYKFIDAANKEFDSAIQADPNQAAPYCEKGKNMLNKATLAKDGKMVAPPGTSEALNKCVELSGNTPAAEEAKQLLAAMGETVSTTYKAKKK